MKTHTHCVRPLCWLSLLAVAGGGLFAAGCAGHRHEEVVEPQRVVIEDEHGFRHEGYYDERRTWHGGYYDKDRQFHRDPDNWRREAAEAIHPELRRNEANARAGAPIEGREERREERHEDRQ